MSFLQINLREKKHMYRLSDRHTHAHINTETQTHNNITHTDTHKTH